MGAYFDKSRLLPILLLTPLLAASFAACTEEGGPAGTAPFASPGPAFTYSQNPEPVVERSPGVLATECPQFEYMAGHGLEVLSTPTLQDYLAPVDANSSGLCFSVYGDRSASKLAIGWHSEEHIPDSWKLTVNDRKDSNYNSNQYVYTPNNSPTYQKNGYWFSDMDVSLIPGVEYELTLGSNAQERLLIRSITAMDSYAVPKQVRMAELFELTRQVHNLKPYGEGSSAHGIGIDVNESTSVDEIVDSLLRLPSLHCGDYALILASLLPDDVEWAVWSMRSLGVDHSVLRVEADGVVMTLDPTLGIAHTCDIAELPSGQCDFLDSMFGTYHPAFWRYADQGIWESSELNEAYSKAEAGQAWIQYAK